MESRKCGTYTNTLGSTPSFLDTLSFLRPSKYIAMAGLLAPSGLPLSSNLRAPFRSQPFHQYSSPYSTTCLSTNDASSIARQDSQKHLDNRNSEPAAELTITPAAIQADDLRISECINKKSDGVGQCGLLSTNKHGQSAQSYTCRSLYSHLIIMMLMPVQASNLKGKAVTTDNVTVRFRRNVVAAERGSLSIYIAQYRCSCN